MRKFTALIILSFLSCHLAAQSPCLPDGITFTAQGQIDNFQVNYPGCTEIEGDVIITGGNISNLEGLSVLTAIYGDLHIGYDPAPTSLPNLTGLENLESVGGSLSIYKNPMLTSIGALGNLSLIGDDLLILQNEILPDLTGLEGIDSVPGNLIIRRNYQLGSLESLQYLTSVGEDLRITLNSSLPDLQGLEGIVSVPGDVVLFNEQMVSLDGLDNLNFIGDNLQIGDQDVFWNIQLQDLSALENLEHVGGVLAIHWNQALESLNGLDNIDGGTVQHLEIIGNPMLSECDVQGICDYLAAPNGTTFIGYNAAGCNSIEEVEEACTSVSMNKNNKLSFTVQPNPAWNGRITFLFGNDPGSLSLRFFNALGQEVYSVQVKSRSITVDVATWQAGIYLAILDKGGTATERVKFIVP